MKKVHRIGQNLMPGSMAHVLAAFGVLAAPRKAKQRCKRTVKRKKARK